MDAAIVLLLMFLFVIKHFLCDFPFQTLDMVKNKGTYGHPDGVIHAAIHGVGTVIVFLVMAVITSGTIPFAFLIISAVLGFFDGLFHYHIDYFKMKYSGTLTPDNPAFWNALGMDQALHYVTYLILIAAFCI